jgi:LysM repeat protein
MNLHKIYGVIFIAFFFNGYSAKAKPMDSIRMELKKGKWYVVYQMEKGQGIFSVCKKYNVERKDLESANRTDLNQLKKGDLIFVPYLVGDTLNELRNAKVMENQKNILKVAVKDTLPKMDEAHANADAIENTFNGKHIVLQGENLLKIAQKYKVTQQQLMKWNNLRSNRINTGQELIVSGALVIKPYEKWNIANSITSKASYQGSVIYNKEVIEQTGLAINNSSVQGLVMKDVPIGTWVLITNLDNAQQCVARVSSNETDKSNDYVLVYDDNIKKQINAGASLRLSIKYAIY